jgi:two-component system sensor histidine kinase VicK
MLLLTFPQQIFYSFIIIMAVAVVFAVVLSILASKRGQVEVKTAVRGGTGSDDEFFGPLLSEVKKLPVSARDRIETTKAIVNLFDQEVNKKISSAAQEITKKYETIIQEKEKTAKIVEEEYKQVKNQYDTVSKNFKKMNIEKRQTEAVVRSMADGVIVVNKKGEVLLLNPAAEKLLGTRKEQKIGRPLLSELKGEQLISMARDTAETEEREIVLQSTNDETKVVLRASNAVIESEDGQTMGMVSVLSDITKQKELDELKEAFVASVSHELRTPLNTVQESLNLLLDGVGGKLNSEQEKILSLGAKNIKRLSRLINDLLDLSKMGAKRLHLQPAVFRVDDLIRQITGTFEAWAKSKKVQIELKLLPEPVEAEADQDRINQVITNLLGNALKFTPSGGKVTIELKKPEVFGPSAPRLVEVGVRDTGPGIPKKDSGKLFKKFVQLAPSASEAVSGTGLGLAISKEIVDLHGGRIWVDSEEGKGSRFAFEIPQKMIQQADPNAS